MRRKKITLLHHDCMTMDESTKHEPQMTFQAAHPTMETHPIAGRTVSELLEDSGNCRQVMNLHLLSDSLFSEQQKLRHVLDWAHSFLSSGSEVHRELCRADSLILADEEQRETQKTSSAYMHSSAAKYHHPITCTAGSDEVFGAFPDDSCIPERDLSGHSLELSKEKVEKEVGAKMEVAKEDARMSERMEKLNEEQESNSTFAKNNMTNSEPDKTQEWIVKTSPPALTVYEEYQFCVDQLHHLRVRQNQNIEPGCFILSPAKEREKSEETAPENPESYEKLIKAGRKQVTAAEITKKRSSGVINKIQDRSEYNRSRATLTEHGRTKHSDKETPAESVCQGNTISSNTHLGLDSNKCGELMKGTAWGITSADNSTPMEHLTAPSHNVPAVEESAALTTDPGIIE